MNQRHEHKAMNKIEGSNAEGSAGQKDIMESDRGGGERSAVTNRRGYQIHSKSMFVNTIIL